MKNYKYRYFHYFCGTAIFYFVGWVLLDFRNYLCLDFVDSKRQYEANVGVMTFFFVALNLGSLISHWDLSVKRRRAAYLDKKAKQKEKTEQWANDIMAELTSDHVKRFYNKLNDDAGFRQSWDAAIGTGDRISIDLLKNIGFNYQKDKK